MPKRRGLIPEQYYDPYAPHRAAVDSFWNTLQGRIEEKRKMQLEIMKEDYKFRQQQALSTQYKPVGDAVVSPETIRAGQQFEKVEKPGQELTDQPVYNYNRKTGVWEQSGTYKGKEPKWLQFTPEETPEMAAKKAGEVESAKQKVRFDYKEKAANLMKEDKQVRDFKTSFDTYVKQAQEAYKSGDEESYNLAISNAKNMASKINELIGAKYPEIDLQESEMQDVLKPAFNVFGVKFGKRTVKQALSDKDMAALQWANKNKNDPRAKSIIKRLGIIGLPEDTE